MDFERVAIQTLFYNYPVELAVEVLEKDDDQCLDSIALLSRWKDMNFTVSEWTLLVQMIKDTWLSNSIVPSHAKTIGKFLLALENVANKVLSIGDHNEPIVQYEKLFRWRDISLCLGEDALVLSYLAKLDEENQYNRSLFLWPDILPHDNKMLNAILKRGVADIHAHYNATTDVFHQNWISLMNKLNDARYKMLNDRFKISQELSLTASKAQYSIPYQRMCVAAAYLRLGLYVTLNNPGESFDFGFVTDILKNEDTCINYLKTLQKQISIQKKDALKTNRRSRAYDYALAKTIPLTEHKQDDIRKIYQGERELLYQCFRRIYHGERTAWQIAQYVYLYLLIKNHIRREIVQTNQLIGFENFSKYEHCKKLYGELSDMAYWIAPMLIYQSAISDPDRDALEARVTPNSVIYCRKKRFGQAVFTQAEVFDKAKIAGSLTFVAHFIKKADKKNIVDGEERHAGFRKTLRDSINKMIRLYDWQEKNEDKELIRLVGIDAASSELECRPEVFAHMYRYAWRKGLHNQTYHVGEDYYDLADGLRAIDEAIVFMGLKNGCRLGHALALSENAKQYYCTRRRNVVISKQYMLDDCVWLYYRAKEFDINYPASLEMYLLNTAAKLYYEIGYSETFNSLSYWHSMLLRGDEVNAADDIDENSSDIWYRTSKCKDDRILVAQKDEEAKKIYGLYHKNKTVRENGRKICIERWKEGIGTLVADIQSAMRREISEKRIAIECCPSSNLKIGHFNRYDEHPIFTFRPIEPKATDPILNVSINTDDRGVFATSLYNEYSLIALAMTKMKDENGHAKYNEEHILDYIERIRQNGFTQRFR